jgi:glutamate dehydrogenase/leucine dehydrogenase
MSEAGAKLVAISDSKGTLVESKGIDAKKLDVTKKSKGTVTAYGGKVLPTHDLIYTNCDILVTAAIPDLVKMADVPKIKAKLIVEGSNIPMSVECEQALAKNGVLVVPDFVANAGGVISSYMEYIGGTEAKMFKLVEEKITKNTQLVLERAKKDKVIPRVAAEKIAKERVLAKCKTCK